MNNAIACTNLFLPVLEYVLEPRLHILFHAGGQNKFMLLVPERWRQGLPVICEGHFHVTIQERLLARGFRKSQKPLQSFLDIVNVARQVRNAPVLSCHENKQTKKKSQRHM